MSDDTPKQGHVSSVATLYLAEPCHPDYNALVAEIAKVQKIDVVSTSQSSVITWGGGRFFAVSNNEPIPRHVYYQIASNNGLWPEALTALASHRATLHLLVQPQPENLLDSLVLQTMLARVFMNHLPVLGVNFGEALISPQTFSYLCGRMQEEGRAPVAAWIRIQISRDGDKTILSTVGMQAFGLMEVECNPSPLAPEDTWAVVEYLISYVLKEGPILGDGDTFEIDQSSHGIIRIHHAPSFRKNVGTVYLIDFS